jgi:DNA-binding transcriptional MerR regulator
MDYSVGKVAGVAGVTVRTLHHYDEIGLLSPSCRSAAGNRRYRESDEEKFEIFRGFTEPDGYRVWPSSRGTPPAPTPPFSR